LVNLAKPAAESAFDVGNLQPECSAESEETNTRHPTGTTVTKGWLGLSQLEIPTGVIRRGRCFTPAVGKNIFTCHSFYWNGSHAMVGGVYSEE
jgi:hypothetical protein